MCARRMPVGRRNEVEKLTLFLGCRVTCFSLSRFVALSVSLLRVCSPMCMDLMASIWWFLAVLCIHKTWLVDARQ
jgi:hypothetical protein